MQAGVAAAGAVGAEALAAQRRLELVADVLPFAHPAEGDEVLLAVAPHRGAGERVREVVVVAPEQQQAVEVGPLVAELRVRLADLLGLLGRPDVGVFAGERGNDGERVAQRGLFVRLVEHPPERRLERELGETAPEGREPKCGRGPMRTCNLRTCNLRTCNLRTCNL